MATEITMPKLGLSMVTGKVGRWLIREGTPVKKGDAVVEIMTDKITNVVEAPADGLLLKAVAAEGDEYPIGALLGWIGPSGDNFTGTPAAQEPTDAEAGEKQKVSPLARKLALEKGIDLSGIAGSGPGGRIVREDIEKAAAMAAAVVNAPAPQPAERSAEKTDYTEVPYSGLRKAIGEHLAQSWTAAPKVDYHVSVDATALLALKESLNASLTERITLTDLMVKIAARALKMRPELNISLSGGRVRRFAEPHIGVAVALQEGLVVPVIKDADRKTLSEVSREARELSRKARAGALNPEDLKGGTFTVTNIGAYRSVDWFTPILNEPEAAILGIGRTVESPAVVGGQVVVRPMTGLSLSFDHRVIDGAPAAEFLAVILKLAENPALALI